MLTSRLKDRLAAGERIVMDGGMGAEIERRGGPATLPLWSAEALLTRPEMVRQIHTEYLRAGAEIIVTDTFRTTRRTFAKKDLADQAATATALACSLACQAREDVRASNEIWIAGSVAPLEDCYSPELTPPQSAVEAEYAELVAQLRQGGVDFILLETMITARETLAGIRAAQQNGLPFAVSFCCNAALTLLDGEPLSRVVRAVEPWQPLFIGVNCVSTAIATTIVRELRKLTTLPVSVYAQGAGLAAGEMADERHLHTYLQATHQWLDAGVQLVGGCCGTTPAYIRALCQLLKQQV